MKCAKLKNWKTKFSGTMLTSDIFTRFQFFSFPVFQFCFPSCTWKTEKLKHWILRYYVDLRYLPQNSVFQFFSFSSCTGRHHPSSDASNFSLLPQWACELTRPVRLSGKSWKNRAFLRELGTSTRPSLPRWHGFGFEENLCCMFPKKSWNHTKQVTVSCFAGQQRRLE
jgi:hypothetical protein